MDSLVRWHAHEYPILLLALTAMLIAGLGGMGLGECAASLFEVTSEQATYVSFAGFAAIYVGCCWLYPECMAPLVAIDCAQNPAEP